MTSTSSKTIKSILFTSIRVLGLIQSHTLMSSHTVGYGWAKPGIFQVGRGKTLQVPMEVHASSRAKVVQLLSGAPYNVSRGVLLVRGGEEQGVYDTDGEPLFRQDSWFNYLFGVKEAGVFGAIDLSTGQATLFIPQLPQEYRIWCGEIHPPQIFAASYAIESVLYTSALVSWLAEQVQKQGPEAKVYVLHGRNSDSGKYPESALRDLGKDQGDDAALLLQALPVEASPALFFHALSTARVTKSESEIEVMRYAAWVASEAHVAVMRTARPGMVEYELEAKFLYEIYAHGGCRRCAYTSICACGPNAAVLHYGHAGAPNDRPLEPGDMALLDMGAEYHGYVSDITCSFPVSGTFTPDQRAVYQGVLNAQRAVLAHMQPGAAWPDCHRLAEREIIAALVGMGLLKSPTPLPDLAGENDAFIEELSKAGLGAVFFPHGLGHLIGCDTHDVGGYLDGTPTRLPGPGLSKLRTARLLEAGMVLTNEPGCYFIDALLDAALADPVQSPYIDPIVLARLRGFGGVRLEDVVVVRAQGPPDNLTTCPRTIQEVEDVLRGGVWPPAVDVAPWLHRRWTRLGDGGATMHMFTVPAVI